MSNYCGTSAREGSKSHNIVGGRGRKHLHELGKREEEIEEKPSDRGRKPTQGLINGKSKKESKLES